MPFSLTTSPFTVKRIYKSLRPMLASTVRRVSYETDVEPYKILQEHPRLIHVLSHGPMLGAWPAAAYLAKKFTDAGGGDRVPFAQIHRALFNIPGLSHFLRRTFNSNRPYSFEEILERFESGYFNDFIVLPEGDNCNFGDLRFVRPFRSHRYVELAVRLQTPILITVHRGTENWATSARLDDFTMRVLHYGLPMLHSRIEDTRIVNVQGFPTRVPFFRMKSRLYEPALTAGELADDPVRRRAQIRRESLRVQEAMNQMLVELDQESWHPAGAELEEFPPLLSPQATTRENPAEQATAPQQSRSTPEAGASGGEVIEVEVRDEGSTASSPANGSAAITNQPAKSGSKRKSKSKNAPEQSTDQSKGKKDSSKDAANERSNNAANNEKKTGNSGKSGPDEDAGTSTT